MLVLAQFINDRLEDIMGRRTGFSLLVYTIEPKTGDRVHYTSNCDRDATVPAIKGLLRQWKELDEDVPFNTIQ